MKIGIYNTINLVPPKSYYKILCSTYYVLFHFIVLTTMPYGIQINLGLFKKTFQVGTVHEV